MSDTRRQVGLVVYRAASDLAGKSAFFVVTLLAARRLSGEAFGVFSLGTTIGWMTAVATDFGIQLHLARAVAQRPEAARRLLVAWLRVRLWTSGIAVVAVSAGLLAMHAPRGVAAAMLLFTLAYAASGLADFLHYFYRALGRSDLESALVLWQRGVLLLLAAAVLLWRPGVALLAMIMLLTSAGALLFSLRIAFRLAGRPDAAPVLTPGGSAGRLSDVLPIGAGLVLSALYFRIDVFLIDAWVGTSAVGLYNAVFRLVEALRLVPAAVLAVVMPALFRATDRTPVIRVATMLTAGAAGATAAGWLAAEWLVPFLYGQAYAPAVRPFQILMLSFPLMSLNYALTHQLIGWQGHRTYAVVCAVALAVNVALNARLIPAAGISGAAWTTLWTEVVVTAGCLAALARRSGAARHAGTSVRQVVAS